MINWENFTVLTETLIIVKELQNIDKKHVILIIKRRKQDITVVTSTFVPLKFCSLCCNKTEDLVNVRMVLRIAKIPHEAKSVQNAE